MAKDLKQFKITQVLTHPTHHVVSLIIVDDEDTLHKNYLMTIAPKQNPNLIGDLPPEISFEATVTEGKLLNKWMKLILRVTKDTALYLTKYIEAFSQGSEDAPCWLYYQPIAETSIAELKEVKKPAKDKKKEAEQDEENDDDEENEDNEDSDDNDTDLVDDL